MKYVHNIDVRTHVQACVCADKHAHTRLLMCGVCVCVWMKGGGGGGGERERRGGMRKRREFMSVFVTQVIVFPPLAEHYP